MNTTSSCGGKPLALNFAYLVTWPWGMLKAIQLMFMCAALICIFCLPSNISHSGVSYLLTVIIIAVMITILSILVNSFYLPQILSSAPFGFVELVYCTLFAVLNFIGSIISFVRAIQGEGGAAAFSFATIFLICAVVAYLANAFLIIFRQWEGTTWMSLLAVKTNESVFEKVDKRNARVTSPPRSSLVLHYDRDSTAQKRTSDASSCGGIVIQVPPTVLPAPSTPAIVPLPYHSTASSTDGESDIEHIDKTEISNSQRSYSFENSVQKFDEL